LVRKHQGDTVQIVETLEERDTVGLLRRALEKAQETNPTAESDANLHVS
jgi:hypothetical protein